MNQYSNYFSVAKKHQKLALLSIIFVTSLLLTGFLPLNVVLAQKKTFRTQEKRKWFTA